MKVLLLNSPIYRERIETSEEYLPSLGLCYIATHLKEANIETEIVDCVKEHLGINEIFNLLVKNQPDYLAMNVFTQNLDIVREIAEQCPGKSTLIIGGQVAKSIFNEILNWNLSSRLIIIIGESEFILPDIIANCCKQEPVYESEVKRVYRVNSSSMYFPLDLGKVHIDRSFLKNDVLINHYGQQEVAIITSRGCSYDCAFCGAASSKNCDISIRYRPNSDTKDEINSIISTHPGVSSIRVLDDLFLRDERSIKMAIELFGMFIDLSWRGMAHILTFINNVGLLPSLRQSGCREMFIGVESGSDFIRRKINKAGTTNQVINVITKILETGIDVKIYLMYGFPDETYCEAEETFALAKKLKHISQSTVGNFRTSVFQFRPYHGTKLYDEIINSGKVIGNVKQNDKLNIFNKRSQFNFYSGNFSGMNDEEINDFILKTQALSEDSDD